MSADAKIWTEKNTDWYSWCGVHDGPCKEGATPHDQGENLSTLIADIETCMEGQMRWEWRIYRSGHLGLAGYRT